jgi:hypothetical protein
MLGDWERANRCWKIAYRTGSIHQLRIIQSAPGRIPVDSFLAVLAPDWKTLRAVWSHYHAAGTSADDLQSLAQYADLAAARETPSLPAAAQAEVWLALGLMQLELQANDAALANFARAAAADPMHYNVRRTLGMTLAQAERWVDAEPHLRWCLSRRPDDRAVSDALALSLRHRGWARSLTPHFGGALETATRETPPRR